MTFIIHFLQFYQIVKSVQYKESSSNILILYLDHKVIRGRGSPAPGIPNANPQFVQNNNSSNPQS